MPGDEIEMHLPPHAANADAGRTSSFHGSFHPGGASGRSVSGRMHGDMRSTYDNPASILHFTFLYFTFCLSRVERMLSSEILIVGTGSVATGVVHALSQVFTRPLEVAILGRSPAKTARLAGIGGARAGAFGTRITFVPHEVANFEALELARLVRRLRPKVVLHAASLQSPWEATHSPSAWTRLVRECGFGITLPLQLALAAEVSRAAEESDAAVVNASYPDAVNVVLQRTGLRADCGIGNAAIVEAFCRAHPKMTGEDVRVVAHHGHFGPWTDSRPARHRPRLWVGGRERDSSPYRPGLGALGEEMNRVTAATAVPILLALLTGAPLRRSLPGVGGLPGGYPWLLRNGKFTMQLPASLPLPEAVAHNKTGERADGLDIDLAERGSAVRFSPKGRRALAAAGFEHAEGFDLHDWRTACDGMMGLRERLRAMPEE